jgi:hypothetical protein
MSFLKGGFGRFHHLSDEIISRLISGELKALNAFRVRTHLEKCWQCRARRESLERAAMQVTEYRNHLIKRTPIDPERRARLLADLRQRAEHTAPQPLLPRSIFSFSERIGALMNPVLASVAIVSCALVLLMLIWQRAPLTVNAAQLLQRAEASDLAVTHEKPGVVYQKLRITTSHIGIERELYRDAEGIRRRRPERVDAKSEQARQILSSVGVDWEAPLSAASYREWHDRQTSVSDAVSKENDHLLILVTKTPNKWIQEESLTVRASDFHPIERTIQTTSYGTVEIAEVNYAVFDWSGVNEALFEPLGSPVTAATVLPPALPTKAQLDLAELETRLALNRLHADEGEQIAVTRASHAIEVKGVVNTAERKQEIVAGLRYLPQVQINLFSISELQTHTKTTLSKEYVTAQSVEVGASPLEKYLNGQSRKEVVLGDISHKLLDAAIKVRQNADELSVLKTNFSALSPSAVEGSALTELSRSYSGRLLMGVDSEESTLRELGFAPPNWPGSNGLQADLEAAVDRNEALCRELIAGSAGESRPASEIVTELYESITQMRSAITAVPWVLNKKM